MPSIPRAAEVNGRPIHSHTGEWCPLCLQEGVRLAARPSDEVTGLDVEVVRRALDRMDGFWSIDHADSEADAVNFVNAYALANQPEPTHGAEPAVWNIDANGVAHSGEWWDGYNAALAALANTKEPDGG